MSRILVVDDEPRLLRAMRINLAARDYDVVTAADGASAVSAAEQSLPDLVVLDLGLPDIDGVDVIRGLREWTTVPILVLSGRVGSRDKIEALEAGADDYVTKPFGIDELIARIRAITRRAGAPADTRPTRVEIGTHTLDLAEKTVSDGLRLTPTEWQIIELLVRSPGKLVSQRQMLAAVWGPHHHNETHYLRQYMAQLRRKLEPDPTRPAHLITEPGMGYRFRP